MDNNQKTIVMEAIVLSKNIRVKRAKIRFKQFKLAMW